MLRSVGATCAKRQVETVPTGEERLTSTLKSHSWPTPVDGRAGQGADIRSGSRHLPVAGSRQCVEQRLCLFEIGGVEAFGEPAVYGGEKVARFAVAALVSAEPGEAHGGA
jgi:hypothetical protein